MNATRAHLKSHEPRVLVSGEKDGRWSAGGKSVDETLCSGVQSWVYAFNGDYVGHRGLTKRDLARYDIAIVNTNRPLAPLARLAGERPASLRWVSLIEGSADEYCLPQDDLRELLDLSDLVDVINRHSLPLFEALSRSRVACVGMPYPVDGVRALAVPPAGRERRVFLCAHLLRRWNDYLVARGVGLPYWGHETAGSPPGRLAQLSERARAGFRGRGSGDNVERARALYHDPALEISPFTKEVRRFYAEAGRACFWVNLDARYTWARFVLDAAALGVPIITTAATGHGPVFFPQTTLEHALDIGSAIDIGRRLVSDPDFYEHVARYPAERMEFLKAEPMKRALLAALEGRKPAA